MKTMLRRSPPAAWLPALIVGSSFLAGAVTGCLFAAFASGDGSAQIREYLNSYMVLAGEDQIAWSMVSVFWSHARWLLACMLLSLTAFGIAALPLLFGVRGFFLAFGVSCFVRVFGAAGLLPALLLFGLPAMLWAPGLFLTGLPGFAGSVALFRRRMGDQTAPVGISGAFISGAVLAVVLLILCVMLECSLLPVLLPAAARILG